jgi:hypothetical protein
MNFPPTLALQNHRIRGQGPLSTHRRTRSLPRRLGGDPAWRGESNSLVIFLDNFLGQCHIGRYDPINKNQKSPKYGVVHSLHHAQLLVFKYFAPSNYGPLKCVNQIGRFQHLQMADVKIAVVIPKWANDAIPVVFLAATKEQWIGESRHFSPDNGPIGL